MKHSLDFLRLFTAAVLASVVTVCSSASAQTAPQAISLSPGWNAVWLEVEPTYPPSHAKAGMAMAPQDIFTNPAVAIVASPKVLSSTAEYFGSAPGDLDPANNFNQDEWLQWKRVDPADVNNLTMMFGNRPYLVYTTAASLISFNVSGKVRFERPKWNADRYNLLGFGLEGTRTFQEFFGPSGTTHPVNKIFTLGSNGSWAPVNPSSTMSSNKAYWIFSSGPSTYTGPVAIDFENSITGVLDYGGSDDAVTVGSDKLDLNEITFSNLSTDSITPSATAIFADPGLSLFRVTPATTGISYVRGNGFLSSFVPIAGNKTFNLTLGAKRTFTDSAAHVSVYRVRTGGKGASFYLPVRAVLSSVEQSASSLGVLPSGPMTGLWVGEVVLDKVSSIVVNGAPVQPAASKAPMRLILHVNATGQVRLLSQVTMMQTKSADPTASSLPVLVVDANKIPFFEGIKERNGKKVGLRIESVAYDMPRSASAWTGPDLVTLASRPTALQETYDLTKLMAGTMGQTLTTTLVLDPYHRSNPMRHAYHQELTKGPKVTRTFTVAFDAQQQLNDELHGNFTEVINGLIKDNLTVSGRLQMRRVSTVSTLDNAQ